MLVAFSAALTSIFLQSCLTAFILAVSGRRLSTGMARALSRVYGDPEGGSTSITRIAICDLAMGSHIVLDRRLICAIPASWYFGTRI
jgi:hypothetical protein